MPLVVAIVGLVGTVLGTIAGVLITQRRSDRREAEVWQREREDNKLRNFEGRRDSAVRFYKALRKVARTIYGWGMGIDERTDVKRGDHLPTGFHLPMYRALEHLRVFGARHIVALAETAYERCMEWGLSAGWANPDDEFKQRHTYYCAAEQDLHDAVRAEIGLKPTLANMGDHRVRYGWVSGDGSLRDAPDVDTGTDPEADDDR